jgi:methylphosphotriester-DNA--protein-cysteine methyltransferase
MRAHWITTSRLEGILGQRHLSRIFDAFSGIIFIAVATAWRAHITEEKKI